MVAGQAIAAETDAAARRLFTTPPQRLLRLIRDQPVELLPPVQGVAVPLPFSWITYADGHGRVSSLRLDLVKRKWECRGSVGDL